MFPVIRAVSEPFATQTTNERPLSGMGAMVVLQVPPTVEGLAAQHAHELSLVFGAGDGVP